MTIEDENLETLRELAAWSDVSEELTNGEIYFADAKGNSYKLPPPGLSSAKRLAWANAHQTPKRAGSPPVSLEELGISAEEFGKLSSSKKLALVNEAMSRRAVNPLQTHGSVKAAERFTVKERA